MSEQARFCETELFFKQHVKLCSLAENGAVISLTNASLQESGAKILMAFWFWLAAYIIQVRLSLFIGLFQRAKIHFSPSNSPF